MSSKGSQMVMAAKTQHQPVYRQKRRLLINYVKKSRKKNALNKLCEKLHIYIVIDTVIYNLMIF